jgi:signal peptidase II
MMDHAVANTAAPAVGTRPTRRFVVAGAVAAAIFAIDQLTKVWALHSLTDEQPRHVLWTLHWTLRYNSGMAFSKGEGKGPIIAVLALLVVGALGWSLRSKHSLFGTVATGLVIGGAIGNVADRLFRAENGLLSGHVVDFIDAFRWWPAFNLADMGVVVGAILLLVESWRHGRRLKSNA